MAQMHVLSLIILPCSYFVIGVVLACIELYVCVKWDHLCVKTSKNQKQQHEACTIINTLFMFLRSPYSISGGYRTQSSQKIYALLKFGVHNHSASQHHHGIKVQEFLGRKISWKTDSISYNNELSFEKLLTPNLQKISPISLHKIASTFNLSLHITKHLSLQEIKIHLTSNIKK